MPTAEQTRLDAARTRREALHEAMVGLEDALSTPIGDGERWRLRVTMAVEHAARRVDEHIEQVEAADGMLQQVTAEVPRLSNRVERLRGDHEELAKEVHALRVALDDIGPDDTERPSEIRSQAMAFLGDLSRHRQGGADLIYEAYQVDIGGHS